MLLACQGFSRLPVLNRRVREHERQPGGRSRFDESQAHLKAEGDKDANGKPWEGRRTRWEGSQTDWPLPGPPGPPPPLQRAGQRLCNIGSTPSCLSPMKLVFFLSASRCRRETQRAQIKRRGVFRSRFLPLQDHSSHYTGFGNHIDLEPS